MVLNNNPLATNKDTLSNGGNGSGIINLLLALIEVQTRARRNSKNNKYTSIQVGEEVVNVNETHHLTTWLNQPVDQALQGRNMKKKRTEKMGSS